MRYAVCVKRNRYMYLISEAVRFSLEENTIQTMSK